MPTPALQAFRAELSSVTSSIPKRPSTLIRDDALKERCRNLLRAWSGNVGPSLRSIVADPSALSKVAAELEAVAKLTAKGKPAGQYLLRLKRAGALLDGLVIVLPPLGAAVAPKQVTGQLFTPTIPDLPLSLVPSGILGWKTTIETFLGSHPFDQSVFVMIRYRRRNDALIRKIKSALKRNGLRAIVASDHDLTDDLYNPIACLLCCSRGLAVFDRAEDSERFNPNVAYELGMLHLLGRKCLILKHSSLKTLQTDILMKLYKQYDRAEEAGKIVDEWAKKALGLATDQD